MRHTQQQKRLVSLQVFVKTIILYVLSVCATNTSSAESLEAFGGVIGGIGKPGILNQLSR